MESQKDEVQIYQPKVNAIKNIDIFELLTSQNPRLECLYVEGAGFRGMKSLGYYLDCCPYKCFLADKEMNIIANIQIPKKEIFIQPYKNKIEGKFPYLFYDHIKAYSCGNYAYQENLMTLLKEFYSKEYKFHLVRKPKSIELLKMLNDDVPIERRYTIIRQNIPLEEIPESVDY